jgi:membrane protein YqaA with SNARE-associated domain
MDQLAQRFITFVDTPWAPILLFVHAFMEASFLPGAHDIFLVAVTIAKPRYAFFFALFSSLGSAAGGTFAYLFGRYFGRALVQKIIHKRIAGTVQTYYQKYGYWAVAIAGFTPVPYKLFAIASGFFKIKLVPFVLISLVARGARFFLVSSLIFFIGPGIKDRLIQSLNVFSVIVLTVIIIVVFMYKKYKKTHGSHTDA